MSTGMALKNALDRAETHERLASRRLSIRIHTVHGDDRSALTITAWFAARNADEFDRQTEAKSRGLCVRRVPWDQLDSRKNDLESLVDQVVAEAERVVGVEVVA